MIESIRERIRRRRENLQLELWSVDTSDVGLTVSRDSVLEFRGRVESWFLEWSEISSLISSKTDNFTYGTIWISVFRNDGFMLSFPDDADGFPAACRSFPRFLRGARDYDDWIRSVARTPFDPDTVEIYRAAAA